MHIVSVSDDAVQEHGGGRGGDGGWSSTGEPDAESPVASLLF